MGIFTMTSRDWGRLDDDRPRRARREQGRQVDHQWHTAVIAPLMDRIGRLYKRVTGAHNHSFSRADDMWLIRWIIALMPLDLAGEDGVGELPLNDDTDLGTEVMMDWKHSAGHHRNPGKGQFGIFDGGWHGTAEDLACDDQG